jgi:hypothetical protein
MTSPSPATGASIPRTPSATESSCWSRSDPYPRQLPPPPLRGRVGVGGLIRGSGSSKFNRASWSLRPPPPRPSPVKARA